MSKGCVVCQYAIWVAEASCTRHVQALARLTPREAYDRAFRFKRASQLSVLNTELPKDQWLKPQEVRSCY